MDLDSFGRNDPVPILLIRKGDINFCPNRGQAGKLARIGTMSLLIPSLSMPPDATELTGLARRRAIAIGNANWFRAVAWKALRDGSPNAGVRAANARAAARIVLRQARRDALVNRITSEALAYDRPAILPATLPESL
ncbi:hypothetical protein [Methylobacterium sp. Leaf113]|uniref:hypothetical protein n=2 Tax=unclassified Methylobacterium TaxID=2615210 RepID=UPI000A4F6D91|nr:hypothetical protein [Methylobacterium sp. Leaf113]